MLYTTSRMGRKKFVRFFVHALLCPTLFAAEKLPNRTAPKAKRASRRARGCCKARA